MFLYFYGRLQSQPILKLQTNFPQFDTIRYITPFSTIALPIARGVLYENKIGNLYNSLITKTTVKRLPQLQKIFHQKFRVSK